MWTKRGIGYGLGHGVGHGLPYGLPYCPSYGLPVVNFFLKLSSSLLQTSVNNVLHQSVISTTFFCSLGGVSPKFSKQTRGRWESAKRECRVNATSRQLSHERSLNIKRLPRISELYMFIPCRLDPSFCHLPKPLQPCVDRRNITTKYAKYVLTTDYVIHLPIAFTIINITI